MRPLPPQDSKISVTTDGADDVIHIPQASGNLMRYFIGAFMLFWLGGWYSGFSSAVSKVSSGEAPSFLIFWLGGWTLGGIFAAYMLYRIFRPTVPESLRLQANSVVYDSGVPAFQMQFGDANQKQSWAAMFPKRTVVEIDRQQLRSLVLRPTESGNRLTLDVGSRRIDLGQAASEIEREWLFRTLTGRYR
jgi:hypothetical protein